MSGARIAMGTIGGCAGLNLTTFRLLVRGGDRGSPIQAGNGAGSLLIEKLKGTADGQRMPLERDPLSDETIASFESWINQGARFDGQDPSQPLREIAAIARAELASHEQLRAERERLARDNWRLAMPDDPPQRVETRHFLLLGNVSAAQLSEIGELAEAQVPRVARTFRAPVDVPLVKGAMTLYALRSSYDYGEFGRMVERRDLPTTAQAHFRYSTVDAYAALNAASSQGEDLEAVLAEQIAGLYIASVGKSPDWFTRGVARATAARLVPRSEFVVRWNQQAAQALADAQAPDDFLAGRSTAQDADLLAYRFARFLMSDSRRFLRLVAALGTGAEFAVAFSENWGATPGQLTTVRAARNGQRAAPQRSAAIKKRVARRAGRRW